jgi:hypothetical protein
LHNAKGNEGHVATRIIHSSSLSGKGKRLAGAAEDHKVNWFGASDLIPIHFRHIAKVSGSRMLGRQDGAGKRIDLGAPSPVHPGHGLFRRSDSAVECSTFHC